jgi:hypothetical protein
MNSDPEQFRERSRTELFFDFLRARFLSIVAVLLVGVGIAMSIGFDLSIPRWVRLVGFTAIAFAPLGFIFGNWLVGLLHDPNYQFLVDLDAAELDGAIYQFPPEDFRELTVTDENGNSDAPYDITQLAPSLYVGKQVDLDERRCVGTWRGTLDDRELARGLRAVKECRGQLQEDAQRGFVLETSAFTIVRSASRGAVLDVIEMFESGTLPDEGASINQAVDDALEDFGFADEVENTIDDLTEAADLNEEPAPDQQRDERRREETNGAESPEQPEQLKND